MCFVILFDIVDGLLFFDLEILVISVVFEEEYSRICCLLVRRFDFCEYDFDLW